MKHETYHHEAVDVPFDKLQEFFNDPKIKMPERHRNLDIIGNVHWLLEAIPLRKMVVPDEYKEALEQLYIDLRKDQENEGDENEK